MNIDQFWNIVDRVHADSAGDMDLKCRLLTKELQQLAGSEVKSFDEHFSNFLYRAYVWDLWGAAYLIEGGCSDDSFMDFRSTLISLGRPVFESAVVIADSLADINIAPEWAIYEGYQYVAPTVYQEITGNHIERANMHPQEVGGVPFKEWEMSQRYPKLAAKYGHNDADYLYLKEREDKELRDLKQAEKLADLMLEAGIVSTSGLIPPFRMVAQVLRLGRAPATTGRQLSWEPFELDEGIYWLAISRLENLQPEILKSRPDLAGTKLKLDVASSGIDNFEEWTAHIKERRLS